MTQRVRERAGGGRITEPELSAFFQGGNVMTQYIFDHIHLFTPDPEGMADYFESMFGAEVNRSDQGGKPRIDLKLGGANIFILDVSGDPNAGEGPAHPHRGLDHFGLTVADIDKVCDELKAKGAKFTRGPETIRPGIRIAFIEGPEGVSVELLERGDHIV
jgi:lactoylglutathione lyase